MTSSASYSFNEKSISNSNFLFDNIMLIINNLILALIFLFITIEEIDWICLSISETTSDYLIDNTN